MKRLLATGLMIVAAGGVMSRADTAVETDASGPKGISIGVYDMGFALVNELRSVTLDKGKNQVHFGQLSSRVDPASISFVPLVGGGKMEALEQQFEYDLAALQGMLARYAGKSIEVVTDSGRVKGTLISYPAAEMEPGQAPVLAVQGEDGTTTVIPDMGAVREILFPRATQLARLEPTLTWSLDSEQGGPQNIRLSYILPGITWSALYETILDSGEKEATMMVRIMLANNSDARFDAARVRLLTTPKGALPPVQTLLESEASTHATEELRYSYGVEQPTAERVAASAEAVHRYDLAAPMTFEPYQTKNIQLYKVEKLPVSRFYVYDGVRFDRFQRNRQNDWNYGTEFQRTVEAFLEFENTKAAGLGMDLPPGTFQIYQQKEDSPLDWIGGDFVTAASADERVHVLLGPARGIQGERERTGYAEITPLHDYEESFEIRLENESADEVEIRVVEHLYRGNEFEIVKSDTEYKASGPQAIEFRPTLKSGGKRSIHYTVKYRW